MFKPTIQKKRGTVLTNIINCFDIHVEQHSRQIELDIAKGFAILFMVWVHVFEELSPQSSGGLYTLVEVLGGPFAAPVFMICMGIGIEFSQHNAPSDLFRRGWHLLGVGMLLNLFRFVLPDLLKFGLTGDGIWLKATFSLFSVDILQFAGLAFLFIALLKKKHLRKFAMMFVALCASLLGLVLCGISTGNAVTDQFFGFLWGVGKETYFPFLHWIIFPVFGMNFGALLRHCVDKRGFYLQVCPLCAAVMLAYLWMTHEYGLMFLSDGSYYMLSTVDAMFFCVLAVLVFGLCYGLGHLLPKMIQRFFLRWSHNINTIYCIHWGFLGFMRAGKELLLPDAALPFWMGAMIAALLLLVSDALAALYKKKWKSLMQKKLIVLWNRRTTTP